MRKIKKSYIVIFILVILTLASLGFSYAFFVSVNEEHGKLNIVVGDLTYKLECDDLEDYKIAIPANTKKELLILLTSLNEVSSKYELYYQLSEPNDDVVIGYSNSTADSVSGTIDPKEKKKITVVINNKSDTGINVFISVAGGLVNNDIILADGNNSFDRKISENSYLYDAIMSDNKILTSTPTLSTSSNNSNDASGLYRSDDTNSGNSTYYFRGNVNNNYISFAGFTWKIIRVNEDKTVRVIMAEGINDNTLYSYTIDSSSSSLLAYYSNSNVKEILDDWFLQNLSLYSFYIATGEYCEAATTTNNSSLTILGNTTMSIDTEYTPTFKCGNDGNDQGIFQSKIGLITYDEVIYAGGYSGISNPDYYLNLSNSKHILTMSLGDSNYNPWYVSSWGLINSNNNNLNGSLSVGSSQVSTFAILPVINLEPNTIVSGSGTSSDPYTINVTSWSFDYTGDVQSFTAPTNGTYKLEVWGAQGTSMGILRGGYGGYSTGTVQLNSNDTLYVVVGGRSSNKCTSYDEEGKCKNNIVPAAYNGGAAGYDGYGTDYGGAGGGATHIATTDRGVLANYVNNQSEVLIVAGGGGGFGDKATESSNSQGNGKDAGGYQGTGTKWSISSSSKGYPSGTQTTGGLGEYREFDDESARGKNGSFGLGGKAACATNTSGFSCAAGAGGGGWYGGGGACGKEGSTDNKGGGGGSGYIGNTLLSNKVMYCYNCDESTDTDTKTTSTTNVSETAISNYAKQGTGYARITYLED